MSYRVRDWIEANRNAPKLWKAPVTEGIAVTGVFKPLAEELKSLHTEIYESAMHALSTRPTFICKGCGVVVEIADGRKRKFCNHLCKDRFEHRNRRMIAQG